EEAADISIRYPVHLRAADSDDERVQCIMWAAAHSKTVREPEEPPHRSRLALRQSPFGRFCLPGRQPRAGAAARPTWGMYPRRPGSARYAPRWSRACRSSRPVLEIRLVFSPSQPVHSGSGILLEFEERLPEQLEGDMVEERGELLLLPVPCHLPYAVQRL